MPNWFRICMGQSDRVCAGCNHEIGYGRFLSCMGTLWHPDCFCCFACKLPIREHEVLHLHITWPFILSMENVRWSFTLIFYIWCIGRNLEHNLTFVGFSFLENECNWQIFWGHFECNLTWFFCSFPCQGVIHTKRPVTRSSTIQNVMFFTIL